MANRTTVTDNTPAVPSITSRQRKLGPAPFASFEDLSDDNDASPQETCRLERMPEIREDGLGRGEEEDVEEPEPGNLHFGPVTLIPNNSQIPAQNQPMTGNASSSVPNSGPTSALQTPSTPRIDISCASSSTPPSEESNSERELFQGGLGLAFNEDGTDDLRSSTEELEFGHDDDIHDERTKKERDRDRETEELLRRASHPANIFNRKTSITPTDPHFDLLNRKPSAHSLYLEGFLSRPCRHSSFGSADRQRPGAISSLSDGRRSASPHKMLLETSFCGNKPIPTPSIDLESPPTQPPDTSLPLHLIPSGGGGAGGGTLSSDSSFESHRPERMTTLTTVQVHHHHHQGNSSQEHHDLHFNAINPLPLTATLQSHAHSPESPKSSDHWKPISPKPQPTPKSSRKGSGHSRRSHNATSPSSPNPSLQQSHLPSTPTATATSTSTSTPRQTHKSSKNPPSTSSNPSPQEPRSPLPLPNSNSRPSASESKNSKKEPPKVPAPRKLHKQRDTVDEVEPGPQKPPRSLETIAQSSRTSGKPPKSPKSPKQETQSNPKGGGKSDGKKDTKGGTSSDETVAFSGCFAGDEITTELKIHEDAMVSVEDVPTNETKGFFLDDSLEDADEEDLPYVPTTLPQEKPAAVKILGVKERRQLSSLVTTTPTQRPRCRRPPNPASLNDYIQHSISMGKTKAGGGGGGQSDGDGDGPWHDAQSSNTSTIKMKINLPRDDSLPDSSTPQRPKSPKKKFSTTWTDFAEMGLRSPREIRRRMREEIDNDHDDQLCAGDPDDTDIHSYQSDSSLETAGPVNGGGAEVIRVRGGVDEMSDEETESLLKLPRVPFANDLDVSSTRSSLVSQEDGPGSPGSYSSAQMDIQEDN